MRIPTKKLLALFAVGIFIFSALAALSLPSFQQFGTNVQNIRSVETDHIKENALPENLVNVTFIETGLPDQTIWQVILNGTEKGNVVPVIPEVFAKNITFSMPAGTYNYSISNYTNFLTSYVPSPNNGKVTVSTNNVSVHINYAPMPLLPWAFTGAYVNYSLFSQNGNSQEFGYSSVSVTSVNASFGFYKAFFVRDLGSTRIANNVLINQEYSWFPPFMIIPSYALLGAFNTGNSSAALVFFSEFINPRNDIMYNSTSIESGIVLQTQIGSFVTDELSATFKYSNGTIIPGSSIHAYYDQNSGVLLQYDTDLSGNLSMSLQSTNIPMSALGSTLFLHVLESNATASINGISLNLSSGKASIFMSPGIYFLSVSAPGYTPTVKEVDLTAGISTYQNVSLSKSTSKMFTLSGYVNPINSSILADQYVAQVNVTGFYRIILPSGTYDISAADNGFFSQTKTITLSKNLSDINFTLLREPAPTVVLFSHNITAEGFNVSVSSLERGNDNISLNYSSAVNGTLIVELPYSIFSSYSYSAILNSTIYVNGTTYSNFTIAIAAQGGNYNIIISVMGLKGDPTLIWSIGTVKQPPNTIFGVNLGDLEIVSIIVVIGVAAALYIAIRRRNK